MPLSFVEAMRGWMRGDTGPEFPVSFELVAAQQRGGMFDVRGVLSAPPLSRETPTHGTLELSPTALIYHLEFTSADGRALALNAVKHPSPLAPVRSMTRMPATISDATGNVVASGEMRFALRDLPGFIASWLPLPRPAVRQLDTRRRTMERLALVGGGSAR